MVRGGGERMGLPARIIALYNDDMTSQDLKELIDREPFQPFLVRMTSGGSYEIRDPSLVVAMKS